MADLELGRRSQAPQSPPDPTRTHFVPAGALKIGLQRREPGLTVHVCDAGSGDEYLRFDLFDADPHYHYIKPGEHSLIVPYDPAASGDMFTWVLDCLSCRVVEMLAFAAGPEVAARVDPADVAAALPAVAASR
jgi:hypothetical protein